MRELRRGVSSPGGQREREQAYPEGEQGQVDQLDDAHIASSSGQRRGRRGSVRSGSGRSSSSSQRWCSRTMPVSPRRQGCRTRHGTCVGPPLVRSCAGEWHAAGPNALTCRRSAWADGCPKPRRSAVRMTARTRPLAAPCGAEEPETYEVAMTTPTSPASGAAPLQTIGEPPPSHVYDPVPAKPRSRSQPRVCSSSAKSPKLSSPSPPATSSSRPTTPEGPPSHRTTPSATASSPC